MQRIELNGEKEPVWLTPYLKDPQPEEERESVCVSLNDTLGLFRHDTAAVTSLNSKLDSKLHCSKFETPFLIDADGCQSGRQDGSCVTGFTNN